MAHPTLLQYRGQARSRRDDWLFPRVGWLALFLVIVFVFKLVVVWQLFRRKWTGAGLAAAGAVTVYVLYFVTDELPTEFLPYTPHIITLVVLALAAQRLRPPAANGMPYRRGEGD